MVPRDEPIRPSGGFESPFLEEIFTGETETGSVPSRASYGIESPFMRAFELEEERYAVPGEDYQVATGTAPNDPNLAVPPFTATQRAALGPLLSPAKNKEAIQWNAKFHPSVSGVDPAQYFDRLARLCGCCGG
jgi:hypothetical protein